MTVSRQSAQTEHISKETDELPFTISTNEGFKQSLYMRVRRVCIEDIIDIELDKVRKIVINNGYPFRFIEKNQKPKEQCPKNTTEDPLHGQSL